MSSLCAEGPPPSRLVLHAPLTGPRAFMDKDSSIVWDRRLRGPPPLKPTQAAPGDSREGPSHMIRVQQCSAGLAHSPGLGGGSCTSG